MSGPTPLDKALLAVERASKNVAAAKAAQEQAESELLALLTMKEEGATTVKTDYYSVTATAKINRTLDLDVLRSIKAELPEAVFQAVFPLKPSLSVTGMRKAEDSEYWPIIAKAITAKPGKTAVKIERLPKE